MIPTEHLGIRTLETLFQGQGWTVTLDQVPRQDGTLDTAGRVRRGSDSVHILAFPKPETVLLIREYRPFLGMDVWMLPGGKADEEGGMTGTPEELLTAAAQRELRQETGFRAAVLHYVRSARYMQSVVQTNHVFIATDLVHDPLPKDEGEDMEVVELKIPEAVDRVLNQSPVHLVSAFALLSYTWRW